MKKEKVCPNCGHIWDSDALFCKECGTNLVGFESVSDPQASKDETNKNKPSVNTLEDIRENSGPSITESKEPTNISSQIKKLKSKKKILIILSIVCISLVGFFVIKNITNEYTTYEAGPIEYEFYKDSSITSQNDISSDLVSAGNHYEFEFVAIQRAKTGFDVSAEKYASELIRLNSTTSEPVMKYSDSKCPVDNVFFIITGKNVTSKYVGTAVFHSGGKQIYVFSVMSDDVRKVKDILQSVKFNTQNEGLNITPKVKK